jgi:predicted nucleic acid-binding protein
MEEQAMIFVDSGPFVAASVPMDEDHAAAVTWFAGNRQPLITTDFIMDEVLTLLRARGAYQHAIEVGEEYSGGEMGDSII